MSLRTRLGLPTPPVPPKAAVPEWIARMKEKRLVAKEYTGAGR